MSHASNLTAPDVDIDVHTTLRLIQEQMQQQQVFMQQQQALLQQQQNRIQQLEAESIEQDGKLVYRNPRATLIKLRQDILKVYPAIGEPKFFDLELPKNHNVFNWNDYHYTEGMDYKPLPVLQHSEVTLTDAAKRHERDLVSIQVFLAQSTRFFDTFAFEVLEDGDDQSELGKKILGLLNTHGNDKEESLFTLESLAAKKAAADLARKTYKNKDNSGSGDKRKDQQFGKSGYKSDGGKSGGKPQNKSGSGQGRKQPDQGNEGEKSD
ncbi:hypothetical protein KI688_007912 [Linnemannia hyalina]|uniref:Uncharacterized protein n=1 Tax=Linnemannia hyalina TaxID=64524 RepID=A0A9P7XI04_9FUNG|nr:hypothetical protein KI688_007912 [Linnemannia hyalina]